MTNEQVLPKNFGAMNPTIQAKSTATTSAHGSDKTESLSGEEEHDAPNASPVTESVLRDFDAYGTLLQTLDLIDSLDENEANQRLEQMADILDNIDTEGKEAENVRSRNLELDESAFPLREDNGGLESIHQTGHDSDFLDCPSKLEENESHQIAEKYPKDLASDWQEAWIRSTEEMDSIDFPRDQYTPEPYMYDTPSEHEDNEMHWNDESTLAGAPSEAEAEEEEEEDEEDFNRQLAHDIARTFDEADQELHHNACKPVAVTNSRNRRRARDARLCFSDSGSDHSLNDSSIHNGERGRSRRPAFRGRGRTSNPTSVFNFPSLPPPFPSRSPSPPPPPPTYGDHHLSARIILPTQQQPRPPQTPQAQAQPRQALQLQRQRPTALSAPLVRALALVGEDLLRSLPTVVLALLGGVEVIGRGMLEQVREVVAFLLRGRDSR
ncbi:MAG: hypothetical protein Q9209_000770 [Squamulea sp. 1 TL-2023]